MNPFDADQVLQAIVGALIRSVARREPRERWAPGKRLKLLLAGYNGTRNTGADVRVAEMVRQFWHVLGRDQAELTVMSIDPSLTQGYFEGARQVILPQVFPKFLRDECPRHHGVVACEGSMFKSKWANALTTMMAGSLGMANAEGKLSVGYGAEAGAMTPSMTDFVRTYCARSFVLCRNEPSRRILTDLGIRSAPGTDTAWTFEPAPLERGAEILRSLGWDGARPVLAACPINPFWWPVKPSIPKLIARYTVGAYRQQHYKSIYFHHHSAESDRKYDAYLEGYATALNAFTQEHSVFPILVGMEKLDRRACERLAQRLKTPAPCVVSDTYDMFDLVSVLRNCTYMVSSRYHAIVTSMPGLVVSAGVTMDERIRNLMHDRGHSHLMLEVDEEGLGEKLLTILRRLASERERIAAEIGRALPRQLELMGGMGIDFADEVARVYPEFPRRDLPRRWDAYLPPLPPHLTRVMEQHA